MYKRRRRRTGNAGPKKGKKKETSSAPSPSSPKPESITMSVTTMDGGESHQNYGHGYHHQSHPDPPIASHHQIMSNNSSKAVGARKRKPTQISKVRTLHSTRSMLSNFFKLVKVKEQKPKTRIQFSFCGAIQK